jgi:hypothetical protein
MTELGPLHCRFCGKTWDGSSVACCDQSFYLSQWFNTPPEDRKNCAHCGVLVPKDADYPWPMRFILLGAEVCKNCYEASKLAAKP